MLRTVYVMWLREVKKFLRSPSRMIAALAQPLFYLLALGYGLGGVFKAAGQGSYVQFLVPGIVGMTIVFTSIFNGMQVIWDRQFGFMKETLVAPVPRSGIMLGRTLGGATISTLQGLVVLALTLAVGFQPHSWGQVAPAIGVMFLVATVYSALGIIVASHLNDMQGFQFVVNFLVMPMFFLSGALFPLSDSPLALRAVAAFDPLSYGVDGMRILLSNVSHFGAAADVTVLSAVAALLLGLGSSRFARMEA